MGLGAAQAIEERDGRRTNKVEGTSQDTTDMRAYEDSRWLAYAPPLPVPDVPNQPSVGQEAVGPVLDEPPEPADPPPVPEVEGADNPQAGAFTVALTFYNCYGQGGGYCGAMSSGLGVYEGAAACGGGMALGTRFSIVGEGRVYVCEDRGLGGYWWIDIFFWDYASGRAWRNQWPQSVEIQVLP